MNNLPVQLTSFIGREEEIRRLKDLLKKTRLLTLTGSGGAGKTRLALHISADMLDEFSDGVWFVEFASLFEPSLLPQAINKIFELKEQPGESLEKILCDYLKKKEILIIFDNCEHLIDACARLTEKLLSSSPKLKMIATSREALRCEGEQAHSVLPLAHPDPKVKVTPEQINQYEAVRLFIERASSVNMNFKIDDNNIDSLIQICSQLEGIPLAIELAAAQVKILSIEQICERLNDRFDFLTRGKRTALSKHQTLKGLIDWSYDLLDENEKLLWRRLSVFAGGWSLEAATQVCSDERIKPEKTLDLLNQLADKSIIVFDEVRGRFQMLETIRQLSFEIFPGTCRDIRAKIDWT